MTPEEDPSRDGGRSEPFVQAIEGRVEHGRERAVERQRQLDRVVAEQVAEGDADQRDAPTRDLGPGAGEQDPAGLQQANSGSAAANSPHDFIKSSMQRGTERRQSRRLGCEGNGWLVLVPGGPTDRSGDRGAYAPGFR